MTDFIQVSQLVKQQREKKNWEEKHTDERTCPPAEKTSYQLIEDWAGD